jgi:hypothetical protein
MILLQYACRYTELERKLREEVSKLEVNLKAVRGERDASVETCKNTKKLYDELKASSGLPLTPRPPSPPRTHARTHARTQAHPHAHERTSARLPMRISPFPLVRACASVCNGRS